MLENYYIQRKVNRRISRSAKLAPYFTIIGLLLFVCALVFHRLGLIQQPELVLIVLISVLFAGSAVLLAGKSFYNLWRSGDAGGQRALSAGFGALIILLPLAFVVGLIAVAPQLHDISTDMEAPLQFHSVMQNQQDIVFRDNRVDSPALLEKIGLRDFIVQNSLSVDDMPDMLQQLAAYPELRGRQYDSALDDVVKTLIPVLKEQGYSTISIFGSVGERVGESAEVSVEAVAKTYFLGLRSDVVLRLKDEGEQTMVDMRAVSRFGRYDLGYNARLIENFFNALDIEMRNAVPDARDE